MTNKHDVGITAALAKHPARVHTEFRDKRTLCRSFESLGEWCDVAEQVGNIGRTRHRFEDKGSTFSEGFTEAIRMARGAGWKGTRKEIAAINMNVAKLVDAETVSDTFQYVHGVAGGAIDMGRFLSGHPACMVYPSPMPIAKRGKVVRIVTPICYSGGTKKADIRRRGSAIVGLIDALARAHYSLEVWGVLAIDAKYGYTDRLAYAVKIQNPATTYNPEMVMYGVGHESMLRVLGFLIEEHENPETIKRFSIGSSYGAYPFSVSVKDLPEYAQNGPAIVLPMLDVMAGETYKTDEGIAEWITEQVRKVKDGELTEE